MFKHLPCVHGFSSNKISYYKQIKMNKVWADKNVNDLAITWTYKVVVVFFT